MTVYEYWVIRYVPDPIRDERVNIGVLAGQDADWAIRRVSNLQRASRLGGTARSTTDFLNRIESSISTNLDQIDSLLEEGSDARALSRDRVENMRPRLNSIVQLSAPRRVVADTADDAADLAFELMVVDAEHHVNPRSRTKIVSRIRHAFEVDPSLRQHVLTTHRLLLGESSSPSSVDLAIKNGVTKQITQAWTFDAKDLVRVENQMLAWTYRMARVRDDGGQLAPRDPRRKARIGVPSDVDINAVYLPPKSSEGTKLLETALEGWSKLGIDSVPVDRADDLVEEARRLVAAN